MEKQKYQDIKCANYEANLHVACDKQRKITNPTKFARYKGIRTPFE